MKTIRSKIPETEKTMPTKIGLHAFYINLYLHEFFEPITPMDKTLTWSERKVSPNFNAKRKAAFQCMI